ncbi:protein crossbronx-related [Anaeramoeba flamelloides]|uniref:Protein crossbronx-related n=1 Tax=Anaeramoeba flamelloides TaxID=1746091 RepID=A0AAV7ZHP1_9EUKA|nr:protein crossbronx-related [Anaeramoeba flamelloides]
MSEQNLPGNFLEYLSSLEYQYLLKSKIPLGVYVLPDLEEPLKWHCVIFLNEGIYKGGIFKFKILFPQEFPNTCPIVIFQSQIFHPQIDKSGMLNTTPEFETWNPYKFHVIDLLKYIKNIFHPIKTKGSVNSSAAQLFEKNKREFEQKVRKNVIDSIKNVYKSTEKGDLQFSKWDSKLEQIGLTILKEKGAEQFLSLQQNENHNLVQFSEKDINQSNVEKITRFFSSIGNKIVEF